MSLGWAGIFFKKGLTPLSNPVAGMRLSIGDGLLRLGLGSGEGGYDDDVVGAVRSGEQERNTSGW